MNRTMNTAQASIRPSMRESDALRRLVAAGRAALLLLAVLAAQGCSVREYALNSLGDALAEGGATYAADDDIELIGAATPFGLKTYESLLAEVPEHRGLLLAAARGFTQYAYVYVQAPAERLMERDVAAGYAEQARARRLYLRARDYGQRGLREAPDDVALLYWTAVAWAAAISLSKDDPGALAGLPEVDALVRRAERIDPDFDHGALHSFLIGYEMSRPNARAGAEARARAHFARAVELSGGMQAGPYVSLAESVCVETRARREFESLLRQALAVDPDARPEWRLVNLVMQRRARRLLARTDELFPE
ncbi:MAG: TRAP transporter TatT component family protein [Burkholderiales bacterium]|nr:TRAP transporter TatT component family protein [Burkholderiales bacterium]